LPTIRIELPTFHPGQVDAYNLKARFKVVRCGRRWGKALALGTPIPTPGGWTTMADIRHGALVFDEAGQICRVHFVSEIMLGRPCSEIEFSDGTSIVADDEHRWLTWDRCARKNARRDKGHARNHRPKVRTTEEIRQTLKSGSRGDTNHSVQPCRPIECEAAALSIPPYVLGAWLGDGVSMGAGFACNDQQIVDEIRAEGQPAHRGKEPFMWHLGRRKAHAVKGEVTLKTRLSALGVLGNKHVPPQYLRASAAQRLALLQGLMDTDGYVSAAGHCEFTSMRPVLARGVLELARSMGVRAVMCTGRATLNGKDCGTKYRVKFTTALPVFRLKRKADRLAARKSDRNVEHRFIVDVKPVESVPVRCIAVDSPSHLYLAGDAFIPTHNTDFGKTIACDGVIKGESIGWFAPDYKRLSEAYVEIANLLEPVRKAKSAVAGVFRAITGGRADFWTLNDINAGRSRRYHKVFIDEAAFTGPEMMDIWEKAIMPTLLDYRGSAIVASNTNGSSQDNFLWQICNEARHGFIEYHAPSSQNPYLPAEELERLKLNTPPLVFQQEYLAEFVDWSGVQFFSRDKMLVDGKPVPFPAHCDVVFATIDTATKTGKEHDGTAVNYWSLSRNTGHKLILLDWDLVQIDGSLLELWLPGIFMNLERLARETRARANVGAFIEDKASGTILLQQAIRKGLDVHAVDSKLTALGKDERCISVSGYVYQGFVKISEPAHSKVVVYKGASRNHWLQQVLGYRIGVKDQEDDNVDTFCYGCAIALGNQEGF
jgi:phage terminase large subunit-like protein